MEEEDDADAEKCLPSELDATEQTIVPTFKVALPTNEPVNTDISIPNKHKTVDDDMIWANRTHPKGLRRSPPFFIVKSRRNLSVKIAKLTKNVFYLLDIYSIRNKPTS